MKANISQMLQSDITSTVVGGLIVFFVGTVPSLIVVFSDSSDLVKTTFIGLSLGGGSIAGAIIGKQQPTAIRDVLLHDAGVNTGEN